MGDSATISICEHRVTPRKGVPGLFTIALTLSPEPDANWEKRFNSQASIMPRSADYAGRFLPAKCSAGVLTVDVSSDLLEARIADLIEHIRATNGWFQRVHLPELARKRAEEAAERAAQTAEAERMGQRLGELLRGSSE